MGLIDCSIDDSTTSVPMSTPTNAGRNDGLLDNIEALLDSKFTKLENELSALKSSLDLFNGTLMSRNDRVNKLEAAARASEVEIIEEINDRNRRAINIVMFNLEEADTTTDKIAVTEILRKIETEDVLGTFSVKRLGRRIPNKPRPTCVTFSSATIPIQILKKKSKYDGLVKISQDSTLKQRNHLNSLRNELRELNNPNKTIRYRNGIPRIVTRDQPSSKND